MASAKRELPADDEAPLGAEAKRPKKEENHNSNSPVAKASEKKKPRVALNPADCNLDFDIQDDGLGGSALHEEGFAYCWSGARANFGINGGKYCFGCKILSNQEVSMEDIPPEQQHLARIGVSRGEDDDGVGNLGETPQSFGFGGTGKFSTAGKFSDYGEKFGVGDTIVCAVDLESKPLASIGFSKNGKWLGIALGFDFNCLKGGGGGKSALFPHVLLKNVVVEMQFTLEQGLVVPEEGYKPWGSAIGDGNVVEGPGFSDIRDCEVMMMVGLPASGKSTWAEKWVKDHPEKRYVLLGTNLVLEQMKVPGLLRKNNYGERFDRLMGRANAIFDTLLSRAARTPRNYVIDQTNVYKSARIRKLRPFESFRKIAVVVFPTPEELKRRGERRFKAMGKEVPAEAVNNMIANYVLPTSKDMHRSYELFDEVIFTELSREEAQRCLDDMKRALNNIINTTAPHSQESSATAWQNPGEYYVGNGGGYWPAAAAYPPPPPPAYQPPPPPALSRPCEPFFYGYRPPLTFDPRLLPRPPPALPPTPYPQSLQHGPPPYWNLYPGGGGCRPPHQGHY